MIIKVYLAVLINFRVCTFMKKTVPLIITILLLPLVSFSQNEQPSGKPVIEIFTDFHSPLKKDNSSTTGFAVNRAYFGYNYIIDKNFSTEIILNLGSPDDLAKGYRARRYAFFREAAFNYNKNGFSVTAGMIKTTYFMFQSTFLGMRYLSKTFQDLNAYGYDSDLGFAAAYKFSDTFQADFSVINGEGGGSLQMDNNLKYCSGLTIQPARNFVIRLYDGIMKNKNVVQNESLVFSGFKNEKFFIGAEFDYKTSLDTISGHNGYGLSATGGINLTRNLMFFSRYDFASSVKLAGEANGWNYGKDSQFAIIGFQYTVSKSLRLALDYQARFPDDKTKSSTQMIFINAGFRI